MCLLTLKVDSMCTGVETASSFASLTFLLCYVFCTGTLFMSICVGD